MFQSLLSVLPARLARLLSPAKPTTTEQRDRASSSRWVTLQTPLEQAKHRHPSNRAYLEELRNEGPDK